MILFKYGQIILHRSFALAMAAAIAAASVGCSGGAQPSSAPSDAPQAATEAAATEAAAVPAVPAAPAAPSAAAGSTAADEKDMPDFIADMADTAATAAAETADTSATTAAEAADTSATAAETAAADDTGSTPASAESDADDTSENGLPKRGKADTALKESVLSEALVECTGWGQSAGSSLRAAAASVRILQWANEVNAASADSALLADTVKAEVKRLSDDQQENLKENWSSISFDASMILDSFDEIRPVLEDAGCSEAAKEISENQDSLANWEAVEHALDAVLE